jgi:hypothetical protein
MLVFSHKTKSAVAGARSVGGLYSQQSGNLYFEQEGSAVCVLPLPVLHSVLILAKAEAYVKR